MSLKAAIAIKVTWYR